jgi:capsular polysaccharide export protein
MAYYATSRVLKPLYPNYRHHKILSVRYEARNWCRSLVRKHLNRWRDKPVMERILRECDGKYFAVACRYTTTARSGRTATTRTCATSSARWCRRSPPARRTASPGSQAPSDGPGPARLPPPADDLCDQLGITGRVHYVHDVHLPTLLRRARGVVTINSTVGLSALYHYKPLKVMGRAMYDMEGLTFQGELSQFWTAKPSFDRNLWRRYRTYLISQTQLNGAFYGLDFQTLLGAEAPGVKQSLSAPLELHSAVAARKVDLSKQGLRHAAA